jgi:hypothetical protein
VDDVELFRLLHDAFKEVDWSNLHSIFPLRAFLWPTRGGRQGSCARACRQDATKVEKCEIALSNKGVASMIAST